MTTNFEKRLAGLELRLMPPPLTRTHVIDARQGDPDALLAAYLANPPGKRAKLIVTLIDATQPKES